MKNLKSIITGILSSAVFFMAVQVGVAGEKLTTVEKVEMLEGIQQDHKWLPVSIINPSNPETNPDNQRVEAEPMDDLPPGDCTPLNSGDICAVELDFSNADQDEIDALLDQLEDASEPNPTIEDFRDAGAEYTGPSNSAVYAFLPAN